MYPNCPPYTTDVTELSWLHQACNINIFLLVPLGEMYCQRRVKKTQFLLFQDNATQEYVYKF